MDNRPPLGADLKARAAPSSEFRSRSTREGVEPSSPDGGLGARSASTAGTTRGPRDFPGITSSPGDGSDEIC